MAVLLNPYLHFRGEARAALELYQSVFGGDLALDAFADSPGMEVPPEESHWVMHGQLQTPSGLTLMCSDTPSSMELTPGTAYSVCLSGGPAEEADLRRYWNGLAADARTTMGLDSAPWGAVFGALTDRFGTNWVVNIGNE